MGVEPPLQEQLHSSSPIRHCYGCGADNMSGLRIKSYMQGEEGVCKWRAEPHHCSYPGFLNGGIACVLIDCHSAWTAFAVECADKGLDMSVEGDPPTGWTRALSVEFLRPTPLDAELELRAKVVKKGESSRTVACSVYANGKECVRGEVTMVMRGV